MSSFPRKCQSLPAVEGPLQSLAISADPLPKNDLNSQNPKAQPAVTFTSNYKIRNVIKLRGTIDEMYVMAMTETCIVR
jgi:hypothetical protein